MCGNVCSWLHTAKAVHWRIWSLWNERGPHWVCIVMFVKLFGIVAKSACILQSRTLCPMQTM